MRSTSMGKANEEMVHPAIIPISRRCCVMVNSLYILEIGFHKVGDCIWDLKIVKCCPDEMGQCRRHLPYLGIPHVSLFPFFLRFVFGVYDSDY